MTVAFETRYHYDGGLTFRWTEDLDKPDRKTWTYVTDVPNDPGPPDEAPVAHLDEHEGMWNIWVREDSLTSRSMEDSIGLPNWEPAYRSL